MSLLQSVREIDLRLAAAYDCIGRETVGEMAARCHLRTATDMLEDLAQNMRLLADPTQPAGVVPLPERHDTREAKRMLDDLIDDHHARKGGGA